VRWLVLVTTIQGSHPVAGQNPIQAIATRAEPAVFRLITELANATAFLVDQRNGLLVTNAHVTSGQRKVTVRLDASYKVAGTVVLEDRRRDIAVVRVNPGAVVGRQALRLDPGAADALRIGDPVIVMGYPLSRGVVTTAGIVSSMSSRLFMTDARVSQGSSGGPVLALDGNVVGVITFLAANPSGNGLGGAISPSIANAAVEGARSSLEGAPPDADSLPVMPSDQYPIEVLEQAASAPDWPVDLYDISEGGPAGGFDVGLFTPALMVRIGGAEVNDLRYWALEMGEYPPVVIARIQQRVAQSVRATVANILLGALGSATNTYFPGVYDPVALRRMSRVTVQKGAELITPIQIKRARTAVQSEPIEVVHVVLPADLFRPEADGSWESVIINVNDPELGPLPWVVQERTMRQVYQDFETYLLGRRGGRPLTNLCRPRPCP
jgi:hypothetical protein